MLEFDVTTRGGRTLLVLGTRTLLSVAPLGLIGVVLALLPARTPMGFVAILGIIALSGMIIRNSVILIDLIDMDLACGRRSC